MTSMISILERPLLRLLLLGGMIVGASACGDRPDMRPPGAFDFIAHMAQAEVTVNGAPAPPLHFLGPSQPWTEDARLFCPAPDGSQILFRDVPLSEGARLEVGYGLRPGAGGFRTLAKDQTVRFRVEFWSGSTHALLLDKSLGLADLEPGQLFQEDIALPRGLQAQGDFMFLCDGTEKAHLFQPTWCGPVLRTGPRPALPSDQRAKFSKIVCRLLDHPAPEGMEAKGRSFRADFDEAQACFLPLEKGRFLVQQAPAVARFLAPSAEGASLSVGLACSREAGGAAGTMIFSARIGGCEVLHETMPAGYQGSPRWVRVPLEVRGEDAPAQIELAATLRRDADAGDSGEDSGAAAVWVHPVLEREATVSRQAAGAGKNVLILVVDALRSDHLSCYGYGRTTTPNLDQAAGQGILFEEARSQSSWTLPSTATLLTGQYAYTHGLYDAYHWALDEGIGTITQSFLEAGVATAAFAANPLVLDNGDLCRGFELVSGAPFANAAQLNRSFLNWLDERKGDRFFAYVHYMEPHLPYAAPGAGLMRFASDPVPGLDPRPGTSETLVRMLEDFMATQPGGKVLSEDLPPDQQNLLRVLIDLYDSEIAYFDACLGKLITELKARGIFDDTILVITADHGEEFLDHGFLRHGQHLHDELLRVPLILLNTRRPPARRTDRAALLDVAPTLLHLAGIAEPPAAGARGGAAFAGIDLLRDPVERKILFAETAHGLRRPDAKEMVVMQAALSGPWKGVLTVDDGAMALFNLTTDPRELRDLSADQPKIAQELKAQIEAWVSACRRDAPATLGRLDAAAFQKLREMGYVK